MLERKIDDNSPTISAISIPQNKKVYVETWGCQMNTADSEDMLALLKEKKGFERATTPEDADLILLNTCHIREKAKHKVLSRLGILRDLKKQKDNLKIAVTGCVAQAEGKKLFEQSSAIDLILGPGKIQELPSLLDHLENSKTKQIAIGFNRHLENDATPQVQLEKPTHSGKREISRYVNIMQGCNNVCTFCVVPFTRGKEISKEKNIILQEVKSFVQQGSCEITLLGQNVNSYGNDFNPAKINTGLFVDLLRETSKIEGLKRLRFTTSNPHDFTYELARLFAEEPKLGRYIHLPVQSGNDIVLDRMNRKVTRAEYLERIAWLKAVDQSIAISTDLIVGFPGETEEQFEDTMSLVEQVRYSFIFAFKYSPRKGTGAARFKEQVPEDVKDARLARLIARQNQITLEENLKEVGQEREVLVQYKSNKEDGFLYGRTPQYRLVRFPGTPEMIGQLVSVNITNANKTALEGVII